VIALPASAQRDGCLYWAARAADARGQIEGPASPRFAEAERYLETLFADYPDGIYEDNGRYQYGMVAYHQENYRLAAERLEAMRARFPASLYHDNATYFAARAHYHLAAYPTAIAGFEALLAEHPESDFVDDGTYYLGRAHFELGLVTGDPLEFEAAIAAFDVVETDFPGGVYGDNAYYYELRAHIELGRCDRALQTAEDLSAAYPGSSYNAMAQDRLATDC
jgi:outer membrane protein assembly factor BamD (BamD/ComL family)